MAEANIMGLNTRTSVKKASDIKSNQTQNVHGYKVNVIKTHLQTEISSTNPRLLEKLWFHDRLRLTLPMVFC